MIRRIAVALVAAICLLVPGLPAEAGGQPFHIRNSTSAGAGGAAGYVDIYSEVGCVGSKYVLKQGQNAESINWDSFRVIGPTNQTFKVTVYSGSTGVKLATRYYYKGTCVRAYKENDYAVLVQFF